MTITVTFPLQPAFGTGSPATTTPTPCSNNEASFVRLSPLFIYISWSSEGKPEYTHVSISALMGWEQKGGCLFFPTPAPSLLLSLLNESLQQWSVPS